MDNRRAVLYLAPWVDYGGTDKGTIDWFRWLDRDRFAPSLITTQPSPNRRLAEVVPYAEEVWALPDLMAGSDMPGFIFDFICSRGIEVLHVMNSRLGFDLLADLACLPHPPKVVVQLHVEEADRMGYVRYVSTRYGNLVDRFSVTSAHLAAAVEGYGVQRDKIRVIYTGVDAEREFSPERVRPIDGLEGDDVHVLYPGRLVEQKDPLLMVDVAEALRDRDLHFQIHAVGDGELKAQVRERVAKRGLQDHVLLHPPSNELPRWYAACDALLMTSVFEGVPYVVFEALAMGLPVVAPALPGNVELLGDDDGLVVRRDSVEDYAAALARLIDDKSLRRAKGAAGREAMLERFSLSRMAADHGELYDELVPPRQVPARNTHAAEPAPLRFSDRPLLGSPLVSILVPHFNQGRFLRDCLQAVRAQSYAELEVIVVDDASTGTEAESALADAENEFGARVIRLEENGGPSRARNVGIESCSGRYVLPVDADNVLLPDAVERLVEQLSAAAEDVGFIYPNLQYFGNREDYYEAPPYDLHELTQYNYCDTCSIFDAAIFEAGERFREDIVLGHEDWEFVLRLASRGVRGEVARGCTLLYRKWGFNRSDAVEYASKPFHELMREISPFREFAAEVKAESAPALSLLLLEPIDVGGELAPRLAARLEGQSCIDVEVIARFDGHWPGTRGIPQVRRIPPTLAGSPFEAFSHAYAVARGPLLGVTSETGSALLSDRGFVEKMLSHFKRHPEIGALAFLDAGEDGGHAFRPVWPGAVDAQAPPHTVFWRSALADDSPGGLHLDPGDPVPSIARFLEANGATVDWRHLRLQSPARSSARAGRWVRVPPRLDKPTGSSDRRRATNGNEPLLPGPGPSVVPRWSMVPTWVPPQSVLLCRHRELGGARRIVTNDRRSPAGFEPERDLGVLRVFSFEGTIRLMRLDNDYIALPRGEWHSAPTQAVELGYAELAPFPLLDSLLLALHRDTGERTLVTYPDDPLIEQVDVIRSIGYIEPFPIQPAWGGAVRRPFGLIGLTKAVDFRSRRHRYALGEMPDGDAVGELGALFDSALPGSRPVWLVDDWLVTDEHDPPPVRPALKTAARWAAAPAAWRGFSEPLPKARAIARRTLQAGGRLARPHRLGGRLDGRPPDGWLGAEERPGSVPLYAAYHPVTGDQMITRLRWEGTDMGYTDPYLLGYARPLAPVTDSLDQDELALPWASRFGMNARRG